MSLYEQTLTEMKRKGDLEKVKWLEGLKTRITLSQKKRIQENDIKVMQELFTPKWVSWELIHSWATKQTEQKNCVLCNKKDSLGLKFKEKFICVSCFIEIKHQQ